MVTGYVALAKTSHGERNVLVFALQKSPVEPVQYNRNQAEAEKHTGKKPSVVAWADEEVAGPAGGNKYQVTNYLKQKTKNSRQ